MRRLTSILSQFTLAARRLWNQRLLMLCLLMGLVAAAGLLSSIPPLRRCGPEQTSPG
jgi:hypothetical protein